MYCFHVLFRQLSVISAGNRDTRSTAEIKDELETTQKDIQIFEGKIRRRKKKLEELEDNFGRTRGLKFWSRAPLILAMIDKVISQKHIGKPEMGGDPAENSKTSFLSTVLEFLLS